MTNSNALTFQAHQREAADALASVTSAATAACTAVEPPSAALIAWFAMPRTYPTAAKILIGLAGISPADVMPLLLDPTRSIEVRTARIAGAMGLFASARGNTRKESDRARAECDMNVLRGSTRGRVALVLAGHAVDWLGASEAERAASILAAVAAAMQRRARP